MDEDMFTLAEVRDFDPNTYAGELETLRCTIRSLPSSANAYPEYRAFIADSVFDITMFQGYDYNADRGDLSLSRETFNDLRDRLSFSTPVKQFEDLKADSGPLVRTIKANGRDLRIEVRIFHSDMFVGKRAEQKALALAEITRRDVFFYNGHAGPYYGFYLDSDREAEISSSDFASAPFTNRKQLFVAAGCQTYSQYADMIYAHPAKNESNLDVITTVNFSYAIGNLRLLRSLIRTDDAGNLDPVNYYEIISDFNSGFPGDSVNINEDVYYGVIGIGDNPALHPFANSATIGETCWTHAGCGDVTGNRCARTSLKTLLLGRCTAVSLSRAACPTGTHFSRIVEGSLAREGVCHK